MEFQDDFATSLENNEESESSLEESLTTCDDFEPVTFEDLSQLFEAIINNPNRKTVRTFKITGQQFVQTIAKYVAVSPPKQWSGLFDKELKNTQNGRPESQHSLFLSLFKRVLSEEYDEKTAQADRTIAKRKEYIESNSTTTRSSNWLTLFRNRICYEKEMSNAKLPLYTAALLYNFYSMFFVFFCK